MLLHGVDLNLIWLVLTLFTLIMIFLGGFINYMETFVPQILSETFRFGKSARGPSQYSLVRYCEVPKWWFLHFYIFSSIYVPLLWGFCLGVYFLEIPAPEPFLRALDFFTNGQRKAGTSAEACFLVMTLLMIQSFRRLYECAFVNVRSNARMNIVHYIVGFVHYFSAATGFVSEAPGFVPELQKVRWLHVQLEWNRLTLGQWALVLIFMWAWWHQFTAHKIFADLKKRSGYSVPTGDWFNYVSCPHYLAEVIIYGCFSGILGFQHQTGMIVFLWVLMNQIIAALMSHFWYQEKFEHYPKQRKAIIPFIL